MPVPGDWFDSLYLSNDAFLDAEDSLIGRVEHTGGLDGLASYTTTATFPLPGTVEGDYRVIVVADSRGQAIQYTHNARGQLTRKSHADGSHEDYTYDNRGNLLTASDEHGTTTFQYDAGDRLTRVTYPNGRFLAYTRDAGGRVTRLEAQDGFLCQPVRLRRPVRRHAGGQRVGLHAGQVLRAERRALHQRGPDQHLWRY